MHIQICTYKYTIYEYTNTHTNTWRRVVRRRHILVRPRRLTIRPKEASHTQPHSQQSARIWELRCPFLRQKVSRGRVVTVSCKKIALLLCYPVYVNGCGDHNSVMSQNWHNFKYICRSYGRRLKCSTSSVCSLFAFPLCLHILFVSLSTTIETKVFVKLCSFGKHSAAFLVNLFLP